MKCHESSYYHHIHQWTSSESVFLACTEEAEGKSCERACFSLASDSAWKTKETLHLMPPELFNPHSRFVQIQSGYNWFIYFWKSLVKIFQIFWKVLRGGRAFSFSNSPGSASYLPSAGEILWISNGKTGQGQQASTKYHTHSTSSNHLEPSWASWKLSCHKTIVRLGDPRDFGQQKWWHHHGHPWSSMVSCGPKARR